MIALVDLGIGLLVVSIAFLIYTAAVKLLKEESKKDDK